MNRLQTLIILNPFVLTFFCGMLEPLMTEMEKNSNKEDKK